MLIDWFTVGAQIVNFLILVWLLKHFLYKPILNAIDAREKRIAGDGFTADHRFVDGAVALKNSPIDGQLLSGPDAKPVPNLHLFQWNVSFAALVVKPLRRLRSQAKQRANRTAGLAASAQLQHLT
jgi:hypothetical protein